MKKLTILGSTGSIGKKTLEVISDNMQLFSVKALVAYKNVNLIIKQCQHFHPKYVAMFDKSSAFLLSKKLKQINIKTEVLSGKKEICDLVSLNDTDEVISAISGSSGLLPTLSAIKSGKTILLANKESLVISGNLFIKETYKNNAKILPIDSEHNAIFQILPIHMQKKIGYMNFEKYGFEKIILTGSGGPFLKTSLKLLENVTPDQACLHPNWRMGKKISVDSATMINKGFEYIEARILFNITHKQIEIILHPESVIHSMIQYYDGSIMAQLAIPDMKIPISYALSWPKRIFSSSYKLNFNDIKSMTFLKPDYDKYPCLKLAIESFQQGQSSVIVLNAANEIAVSAFLNNKIKFTDIFRFNIRILELLSFKEPKNIKSILNIHKEAKRLSKEILNHFL